MNEELNEAVRKLQKELAEAKAEIERLTLDVHLLTEELEYERRPKMDQR